MIPGESAAVQLCRVSRRKTGREPVPVHVPRSSSCTRTKCRYSFPYLFHVPVPVPSPLSSTRTGACSCPVRSDPDAKCCSQSETQNVDHAFPHGCYRLRTGLPSCRRGESDEHSRTDHFNGFPENVRERRDALIAGRSR